MSGAVTTTIRSTRCSRRKLVRIFLPPSIMSVRNPELRTHAAIIPGAMCPSESVSIPSTRTPSCSSAAALELSAETRLHSTIVGIEPAVSTSLHLVGIWSAVSTTMRLGVSSEMIVPPDGATFPSASSLHVSSGSSAITVPMPTSTASESRRRRWASVRVAPPEIHRDTPVRVAILPSMLCAKLSVIFGDDSVTILIINRSCGWFKPPPPPADNTGDGKAVDFADRLNLTAA